ncbi:MAG: type II toxin-antitoxin system prevent-host-death family antitoxin [Lachnospiraceae bacterium]|nr:type II toxin-antitoxin system prevent-host-death family antitoxin [Lachnospiraceae bacterium]
MQVNVFEAKTEFSKLIRLIESGREESVTVARNGRPVVKIVPYESTPVSNRIGIAKGKFTVPDDFDAGNEEIAAMLTGGGV